MESLYILIPVTMVLVFVGVCVFIFAVKSNQFEDLERQGMNILLDDEKSVRQKKDPVHHDHDQ